MPWTQLTRHVSGEVDLDSSSDVEVAIAPTGIGLPAASDSEEYDPGFNLAERPAGQSPALTPDDGDPLIAACYEAVNKCKQPIKLPGAIAARSSLAPPQAYDLLRAILDRRWKHINNTRNTLHNDTN